MRWLIFLAACTSPSDVTGAATISLGDSQLAQASATFDAGDAGLDVQFYAAPEKTPCADLYKFAIVGSLHLYPVPAGGDTIELVAENQAALADSGHFLSGEVDIYGISSDQFSARIRGIDGMSRQDLLTFAARGCSDQQHE